MHELFIMQRVIEILDHPHDVYMAIDSRLIGFCPNDEFRILTEPDIWVSTGIRHMLSFSINVHQTLVALLGIDDFTARVVRLDVSTKQEMLNHLRGYLTL